MLRGIRSPSLICVQHGRSFFTKTCSLLLETSAQERAREDELRQKIQQKHHGMPVSPIINHQYGHFSTMGISMTAAQQATSDASSQGYSSFNGQFFQTQGRVDWIMLLTGCALVYFSGKILFNQFTRGVNGLELPLWTASVELQAKHLLFAVQFSQNEQEQLKTEFEAIRQKNPFANFFEWLRSRRPEYCAGRKYTPDYVMNVLVSTLRSDDSTQLTTLVRALQLSLRQQTGDSLQHVDDFMERLKSTGYFSQTGRSTASASTFIPSRQPPTAFIPPVEQMQGGAERYNLNSAPKAKTGDAHSTTPFDDTK